MSIRLYCIIPGRARNSWDERARISRQPRRPEAIEDAPGIARSRHSLRHAAERH